MINLSKNFTLEEMVVTNTGLPNIPQDIHKEKLLYLANYIMQPIRDKWGEVTICSGYRSIEVNKVIGGSDTSQHIQGEAADFILPDMDKVFDWIVLNIKFGQCIRESKNIKEWIHISLPRLNQVNQQAFKLLK